MVGKDGTSGIGNGHLRTGMQFQFRYRAAAKPDDAKILDNNAINTDIAEERDIVPSAFISSSVTRVLTVT